MGLIIIMYIIHMYVSLNKDTLKTSNGVNAIVGILCYITVSVSEILFEAGNQ